MCPNCQISVGHWSKIWFLSTAENPLQAYKSLDGSHRRDVPLPPGKGYDPLHTDQLFFLAAAQVCIRARVCDVCVCVCVCVMCVDWSAFCSTSRAIVELSGELSDADTNG